MKTKIFTLVFSVLLFVLILQNISSAQSVWSTEYLSNVGGNNLRRVDFINNLTGYACGGNGTLIKTIDGGDTWTTINLGTTSFLTSMFFLNANTGWVGSASTVIRKTTDGGASWSSQTAAVGNYVADILFFNDQTGYATGDAPLTAGQFFKTTNGGTDWISISTSSFAWGEIHFLNEQTGWVEAPNYFAKTTDGGVTWNRLLYSGFNQDFSFINEQTGWVVNNNSIQKTINGGDSWSYSSMPVASPFSLIFFDQNTGWCAGYNATSGIICRTLDGGSTWTVQTSVSGNKFYELSFINQSTGWACGNSIISGTQNGTTEIHPVSTSVPGKFALKQNYPNPFNPATKINFDIKNASFASLKVYDMTGKEVKSLVSENLSAGSYEVNFNAAELNSGVYFYTLRTNDFSETKKMMLVK